jgi:hypothetical protein
MTIQDMGALAEVIGAIAVVVTLIYLAIQTRQARIAAEQTADLARLESTASVVEAYSRWRVMVATHPDLANLISRANREEEISPEEHVQLSAAFEERILASVLSYATSAGAGSVHSISADVDYLADFLNDNPAAIADWNRMRQFMSVSFPDFVTAVDAKMSVNESAA